MTRLHDDDTVVTMGRKGLSIALPGAKWRVLRKTIAARFRPTMCGRAIFLEIYAGIERSGRAPMALRPRERLGLIRLAVKLVSTGPTMKCECKRCRPFERELHG